MNPRQSSTTHTESLGDEASVYDWAHAQVHALNPTAARVWRLCDGATSPDAIAVTLHREQGIPEAAAVVELTLKELSRLHLLELPVESLSERRTPTRRWLLERGLAAALLPAVYTILTPSPLEAQSPGGPPTSGGAPTLSSLSPNQGAAGTTLAVTLTGTNFVAGATVAVSGAGVTVNPVVLGGPTSLTTSFVIAPTAATGARTVTVTTPGGTSGAQSFTINAPAPGAPTLTTIAPNQGTQGTTVAVTLTGTNFIIGATTLNVSGAGLTVNTIVVGSTTSLTANFVLDLAAAAGPRTVTVTTAGGTSGPQTFTINVPPPGSMTFTFTAPGGPQTFTVPAGVVSVTIVAIGAKGGNGLGALGGVGGLGGRVTATVPVTPGASLTVRVGGIGPNGLENITTPGGFNGGGASPGDGGGGGGASSVRAGDTPLVIGGGGGGGGDAVALVGGANGGAGGSLDGDIGSVIGNTAGPGGGGGQNLLGGLGGFGVQGGTPGSNGTADQGGAGGEHLGQAGGGGGGGGYFGGGGGGGGSQSNDIGGGGGGGGSSFTALGAKSVLHEKGVNSGAGSVTISW